MKVFNDISNFYATNPVVTIGIFDGVHLGHVEIINMVKQLAKKYKGESVVVTLWPHPRYVLQPGNKDFHLLTSLDEKTRLIENHGIDKVMVLPFTKELSDVAFDRFLKEYLVDKIGMKHLVVGYNHHFGKDRKGTFENLQKFAHEYGFGIDKVSPVVKSDSRVSSSGIRHMIEEGRITAANEALGYPYFINGIVVEGNKLGRKIGFPTANIQPADENKLLPMNGVYAANVELKGNQYRGMMNIGIRPTISGKKHERTIEVHIFDFKEDIYNLPIKVSFLEWLRYERKFASMDELKEQLSIDKSEVLKIFKTI